MPEQNKKMSRLKSRLPDGVYTPFMITIAVTVITCLTAGIGYFFLPPEIPLFYSLALSSQQLATKEMIFVLPGLSVLFALINNSMILRLHRYDILLIRLFAWITTVCVSLILFALIRILTIVL